jgi:hypothetical protein
MPELYKERHDDRLAFRTVASYRTTSPLIMGVVFVHCVTPIVMRQLGKDVLSLGRRPDLSRCAAPLRREFACETRFQNGRHLPRSKDAMWSASHKRYAFASWQNRRTTDSFSQGPSINQRMRTRRDIRRRRVFVIAAKYLEAYSHAFRYPEK